MAALRVRPIAGGFALTNRAGVVAVTLGDHPELPSQLLRKLVDSRADRLENVRRRRVDDGVHGVETQAVATVVAQPHLDVVEHESPDVVRILAVVVHGPAPWRLVSLGEVRAERREVVTLGPGVAV